jgi:hypothetical protein
MPATRRCRHYWQLPAFGECVAIPKKLGFPWFVWWTLDLPVSFVSGGTLPDLHPPVGLQVHVRQLIFSKNS